MKHISILILCLITYTSSFSQTTEEHYRHADSLFRIKDYKRSASLYSTTIRSEGIQNANINRHRAAAAAWALAGEKDSAFYYLEILSASRNMNRVVARNILYGADFTSLHDQKKWTELSGKIVQRADEVGYKQIEHIYGRKDGMALTLVEIKPKVQPNGKAIIYVISGSWVSSYNGIEVQTTPAEQFLNKGYTVFAVMHGSQPRYTIPEAIADVKRAVRYVRYNARTLGIEPNRIGITGTSAGGHLSLMVATTDDRINASAQDPVDRVSSRVQAVAVLFPPTDLVNWGGPGINLVNATEILKANRAWGPFDFRVLNEQLRHFEAITDTAERSRIGKAASPIYFVTADDPPVFIIHGDADPTVPVQQSHDIIARFKEVGVQNQLIIKKGGKHNGFDMNPEWQQFVDWFEKQLR